MYKIVDWAQTKFTSVFIFLGFNCLKIYSSICVFTKNLICEQYYKNIMLQSYMDVIFEWHHFFMTSVLKINTEPLYNPWISIYYMKFGKQNEKYYNIKKTVDLATIMDGPSYNQRKDLSIEKDSQDSQDSQDISKTQLVEGSDMQSIGDILDFIYNAFNYIKTNHFDTCYDFLVLLKYKNFYISRVGIYEGIKNLRKEDFKTEKVAKSILMVEYTHPRMAKSIILNIDTGYFIENNEILSPMFIYRALNYQTSTFIFDYGYKLTVMDSNIKTFTIDSKNFILIKKNGYEIINIS